MSEQDDQEALFSMIRTYERKYPELRLAFHTANEGRHTPGYRAKLARQGVRAGIPDCLIPVKRGECCGLALELKIKPNRATPAQREYLALLESQGWQTAICYGWEQAWGLIHAYVTQEVSA